jgi:hypothetical protein
MVFDAHASDTHPDPPIVRVGDRFVIPKLVPAITNDVPPDVAPLKVGMDVTTCKAELEHGSCLRRWR